MRLAAMVFVRLFCATPMDGIVVVSIFETDAPSRVNGGIEAVSGSCAVGL
jgi:hypothetical protein